MRLKLLIFLLVVLWISCPALAQQRGAGGAVPSIAEKTAGMEKRDGYFTYYWDAKAGKIWLEIDKWDAEFLYITSLPAGLGSNDVGLDRGQLGMREVAKFQRSGPKVLLTAVNYSYRAVGTDNADERRAVEESFAQSVLWGFEVAAEDGGKVLVDGSNFYLRDAHDVTGTLRRTQQGQFRLDASRAAFYLPRTKNFPQNTEVEVTLTFTGDDPGGFVRQVTPVPQAVTVRQHHSFIQLPDGNYQPRAFDPRGGFFGIQYLDYSTPIASPIVKRFISRHRLQKKTPGAAISEPVKPIIYYLDRGAPEPIRSALLDGARWWNQAFEAAGFKDGFRVELMPEGADSMDVRYNVIQWVHRSTRGWSYGASVTDPRTGEIIKGHVTLGSLRVRQDFLIAEGLTAPYESGQPADNPRQRAAVAMALARLRQLSAHEVGHTLGIQHNYISSVANRASVMDYPHPLAKLSADGSIDLSDAYDQKIGEWDKVAVTWGYSEFPGDEARQREAVLAQARTRGLHFLSDQDARPPGSAHPTTHLWDNGVNAVDELKRLMDVRRAALKNFGERNIAPGAPMATIEEALVPVYLLHRYQVEAASKIVGGLTYTYALRGDAQRPLEMIPPAEQRRALAAVLETLKPGELALPESLLAQLPPRPTGYPRTRETFRARSGLTFDSLAPAEAAASHVLGLLLNGERASRLVEYHARDAGQPGLDELIDKILAETWRSPRAPATMGYAAAIERVIDEAALYHLMALAANERARGAARAMAHLKLDELRRWLVSQSSVANTALRAHYAFAAAQIKRFQDDPKTITLPRPMEPPDGPPIGADEDWCNWRGAL